MFKNQSLRLIMQLESQLSAIDILISEAETRFDLATIEHYNKVRKLISHKLNVILQDHKESLEHDYELVYSC